MMTVLTMIPARLIRLRLFANHEFAIDDHIIYYILRLWKKVPIVVESQSD